MTTAVGCGVKCRCLAVQVSHQTQLLLVQMVIFSVCIFLEVQRTLH